MTQPNADHPPTPDHLVAAGTPPAARRALTGQQPAGQSASGGLLAVTTGPAGVLVPFEVGHQPRFPVGYRVTIPHVPADLLPATAAIRRPPSRNRRRALLVGALAIVAVLFLAGLTAIRAASGPGPRDVVTEFFAVLTAHDPTRLLVDPCHDNPLCVPNALDAGYQPPENISIGDDTGTSDDRHVPVTYTVAGQRTTITVDVHATSAGMFRSRIWTITTPPGAQLTVPDQTPAPITIAATRLPAHQPGQQTPTTMWAPPGQYTLTRAETPLLTAAQTTITVTDGTPLTITLPKDIRPAAADTIQRLIHDRIDTCAAKQAFTPSVGASATTWHSCPIAYEDRYTITTDPTWSINTYPQLHLEPTDDGAIAVTTTHPGQATIRFRWSLNVVEPRTWTDLSDTVEITVTGLITAASGTFAWQPA